MQINPHSTGGDNLGAVALCAPGLRSGPNRIPFERVLRSGVRRRWAFNADLFGLVRGFDSLAVPSVPSAVRTV